MYFNVNGRSTSGAACFATSLRLPSIALDEYGALIWRCGVTLMKEPLMRHALIAVTSLSLIAVPSAAIAQQAGQLIAGNRVDLSTTFTQNGAARTVGAIDFQVNNFYSQFSAQVVDQAGNPVAITAQALALPQMNGSGMVRNMQAAASYC